MTDLSSVLQGIATGGEVQLFGDQTNLMFEKFHPFLTRDLLQADALSARLDQSSLEKVCSGIIQGAFVE